MSDRYPLGLASAPWLPETVTVSLVTTRDVYGKATAWDRIVVPAKVRITSIEQMEHGMREKRAGCRIWLPANNGISIDLGTLITARGIDYTVVYVDARTDQQGETHLIIADCVKKASEVSV